MICEGTSIVCVTCSRSTVSMNASRVECAVQHIRGADHERREHRQHRSVEDDRARVQHDRFRRHPPRIGEHCRVHRPDEMRVLDALRLPGRPGRIHQGEQVVGEDLRVRCDVTRAGVEDAISAVPCRIVGRRVGAEPTPARTAVVCARRPASEFARTTRAPLSAAHRRAATRDPSRSASATAASAAAPSFAQAQ